MRLPPTESLARDDAMPNKSLYCEPVRDKGKVFALHRLRACDEPVTHLTGIRFDSVKYRHFGGIEEIDHLENDPSKGVCVGVRGQVAISRSFRAFV